MWASGEASQESVNKATNALASIVSGVSSDDLPKLKDTLEGFEKALSDSGKSVSKSEFDQITKAFNKIITTSVKDEKARGELVAQTNKLASTWGNNEEEQNNCTKR